MCIETCTNKAEVEEVITRKVVADLEKRRIVEGLAGSTLSTQLTTFRVKVFEQSLLDNISMGMLERFKPALDISGTLQLGNAFDLPRTFSSALKSKNMMKIHMILE